MGGAPLWRRALIAWVDDEVVSAERVPERQLPHLVSIGVPCGVLATVLDLIAPGVILRRWRGVEADTEAALNGNAGEVGRLAGGGGEAVEEVTSALLAGRDEEGGTACAQGAGGTVESDPISVIGNRGEVALGAGELRGRVVESSW